MKIGVSRIRRRQCRCFATHNKRIDREGARLSCTADICHFYYCRVFNPANRPRSLRHGTGGAIRKRVSDAFSRSISHCARNDRSPPPLRAWYTYPDRNCRISVGCCGFPAKYITFLYVRRYERIVRADRWRFANFVCCKGNSRSHVRNSKRRSLLTMSSS